jgi:hypothetical protein
MRRRAIPKITLVSCAVTGCGQEGRFQYDNQRDAGRIHREQSGRWKCDKHRWVDVELRPDRPTSVQRLIATKHPGCGDALFWYPDHARTGSGFASGPGFVAKTEHWPEGAVLEVTAKVYVPSETGSEE